MGRSKPLFELQQVDLDMDAKRKSLRQVEGGLGDRGALAGPENGLKAAHEDLANLEKEQRSLDGEAEDLAARIKSDSDKLYGGAVKNPKELASIQHDLEGLQQKKSEKDDRLLELLDLIEKARSGVKEKKTQFERATGEWETEQERLAKEKEVLTADLKSLEDKHTEMAAAIDPEDLKLYESLRRTKGKAVAKLEFGRCQGCRITLSLAELHKAKTGRVMQCSSCHVILYMG